MADQAPSITSNAAEVCFDRGRFTALLEMLERMAAGGVDVRLPISPHHDALDALAYGINVLVGELSWASARAKEVQDQKAAELQAAVASAEARSSAMLKAIPDLMFVLLRDGTFVDYHSRDVKLLFVPPAQFLGRKASDILPPAVADLMLDALERASQSDDPVVVEYELPMGEPRFFEARIVQVGPDRLLSMVRDITDAKRSSELNHDLARRLIASQESERQRLARELHDDVSQRLALLNIEIDQIAEQVDGEALRARVRKLYGQASEIASDVHHISYDLHPTKLRTIGLVAALQSLCRDTSKQRNLHVAFTHGAIPPSLDANVSLCVYRIVQEALHNVARHSQAREAQVSVTCDDHQIALRIADSGVGFDPRHLPHAGLGLVSMRERVVTVKGHLAIEAVPGRGTKISVRIPLVFAHAP
jgi:signal transduction histidine kinase